MASRPAALKENAAPSGAAPAGRQLAPGELKAMLSQCLKMASENKITGQNTWGLPLIEHLDDLVREDAPGQHTNFQRASVTLEAGMKIYGYRVDSIHTETFKILGGLGRASGPGQEADGARRRRHCRRR
jgi:condensin complex subunit 2